MGDYFWSNGCRADVEYYGYPGIGSYYRTARFGTRWVGGGVYAKFAEGGRFECNVQPFLGAPVKDYGWISEAENGQGAPGQWFENGAIVYHHGAWHIMYGQYGQTAGRLTAEPEPPLDAEVPPDAPGEPPELP